MECNFGGVILDTGLFTLTDTEGKVSVTGGNLSISGGYATPGWGGPALVSKAPYVWARAAGLTIEWEITPGATNKELLVGFSDGSLAANAAEAHGIYLKDTGIISIIANAVTGLVTPLAYTATSLWGRITCIRQPDGTLAGANYYVSTDNRVTWKIIGRDDTVTISPLYAFGESYNAALTSARALVYHGAVKPALVSDTFTRDDSALTLGSAETGQAWTAVSGTWGISGNKAYSVNSVSTDKAIVESGAADGIVDCDIVGSYAAGAYSLPDILLRYIDTDNTLLVEFYNNIVSLYKLDGGGFTELANAAFAMVAGTTYSVRAVMVGNAIAVYVDGVSKISHTLAGGDTKYAVATKHGFRHGGISGVPGTPARWDNFTVNSGLP